MPPPPPVVHAPPASVILPLASICKQWLVVKAPDMVAKLILELVFCTVPTVTTAPAPPPITGLLAVNAADEVIVPLAVYVGTPPDVPDAKPVPPLATGICPVKVLVPSANVNPAPVAPLVKVPTVARFGNEVVVVETNVPVVGKVTLVEPVVVRVKLLAPDKAKETAEGIVNDPLVVVIVSPLMLVAVATSKNGVTKFGDV